MEPDLSLKSNIECDFASYGMVMDVNMFKYATVPIHLLWKMEIFVIAAKKENEFFALWCISVGWCMFSSTVLYYLSITFTCSSVLSCDVCMIDVDLKWQRDARDSREQNITESKDSYDMEDLAMPLQEYINHPVAVDIVHNGATFQVLQQLFLYVLRIWCFSFWKYYEYLTVFWNHDSTGVCFPGICVSVLMPLIIDTKKIKWMHIFSKPQHCLLILLLYDPLSPYCLNTKCHSFRLNSNWLTRWDCSV